MKKYLIFFICLFYTLNIIQGQVTNESDSSGEKNIKVATYLYFKFNAKEAIETYKSIFDATVVCEYTFSEGMTEKEELLGKVFHAELKIGDLNLYLCDSGEDPSYSSMKFVVEINDEVKARKCFDALAQNGKIISDFTKMPYGPTIAEVVDKFGVMWNIVIC